MVQTEEEEILVKLAQEREDEVRIRARAGLSKRCINVREELSAC